MTKRKAKNKEKTKQTPSINKKSRYRCSARERAKCINPDEEQSITILLKMLNLKTFSCDLHFELGFAMLFDITLR